MKKEMALVLRVWNLKIAMCAYAAVFFAAVSLAAPEVKPIDWENIDPTHHLAGRMASAGYLRGKVVLLDCRDYGDKSGVDAMRRLEEV